MIILFSMALLACSVNTPIGLVENGIHPTDAVTRDGGDITISTQGAATQDGTLWVQVLEPVDGTIVHEPSVAVKGESSLETVITVNDEIIYCPEGRFELSVPLAWGDNLLEIVASDIQGNEVSFYLLVTRE